MKNFADRTVDVAFSPVRKVLEQAEQMQEKGERVIHLEIGEPDFHTPSHIVEATQKALTNGYTHYFPNRGYLPLRQAIKERLLQTGKVLYNPDSEIILTAGAAEGILDAILGLVDPGDEVIGFTPAFMNYKNATILAGAKFVEIALRQENNFQIDIEELKRAITPRTRMIVLNNPQNPCGTVHKAEILEELAELARQNDLLVLSDEIYDSILYDGASFCSVASLPGMKERTICINGFSKSFAMTGWRVGYLATDKALLPAVLKLHQYNTCCIPSFIQVALTETMNHTDSLCSTRNMVSQFEKRRALLLRELGAIPHLSFVAPMGAFYMMINVEKTGLSGTVFAERLLREQAVAVVPGIGFGDTFGRYIRISFAASTDDILEGVKRIGAFAASLPEAESD